MSSSVKKSKNEKEREKVIQDRLQLLLTRMLKDDDNKYCVDCDSKGPRWASWNLGLFLCIRCAGIHRNLGVHISKVKSVNLDSWTPMQVSSMQLMGNSRARAVYEANLPDGFIRPQNDQALEQFIRAKYEKKKYIAKEYVPQSPNEYPDGWFELIEAEKQKKDLRKIILPSHRGSNDDARIGSAEAKQDEKIARPTAGVTLNENSLKKSVSSVPSGIRAPPPSAAASSVDLLGLDLGTNPPSSSANASQAKTGNNAFADLNSFATPPHTTSSSSNDLLGLVSETHDSNVSSEPQKQNQSENFFESKASSAKETNGKLSKDSIMALFAKSQPANFASNAQTGINSGNLNVNRGLEANMQNHQSSFSSFHQLPNNPFLQTGSAQPVNANIMYVGGGLPGSAFGQQPQQQSNPMFPQTTQVQNQLSGLNLGGSSSSNFATATSSGSNNLFSTPADQAAQNSQSNNLLGLWR